MLPRPTRLAAATDQREGARGGRLDANGGQMKRNKSDFTYISCTFGMMPAAFGPVLPATSRITVMLVYAEETPPDFAREVSVGTRYVGEK